MEKLKIYFAGAIRSCRDKVEDYKKISEFIEEYADILDKHVVDPGFSSDGESISKKEIYERDIKYINQCDVVVAEVTSPSLGVGYEIAYAEKLGKKIICLCENNVNLSAIIGGDPNLDLFFYSSVDELKDLFYNILL